MTERVGATAGELIAGRYRLTTPVRADAGNALWHADDEILGRAVAVRLVCGPPERLAALHAATTRAGRLVHESIAAVYDTDTDGDCVYIVREWVPGQSLEALLAAGPFDVQRVTDLGVQLSEVLAAVLDVGLRHQRLHPRNIVITPNGGLKLTDLETADALDSRHAPEARWFGATVYAGLTARWPNTELAGDSALADAPTNDNDEPCTPAQQRAGVPAVLDSVAMRALTSTEPASAAELHALAEPLRQLPRSARRDRDDPPSDPRLVRIQQRPRWRVPVIAAAAAIVLVVIIAVASSVVGPNGQLPLFRDDPAGRTSAAPTSATAAAPMTVASVFDYDPLGDGREDSGRVALTVNGNADDGWHTDGYFDPLSMIKQGVGVVVDMGKPVTPARVAVTFDRPGVQWELRAAEAAAPSFAQTRAVGAASGDGPRSAVTLNGKESARYWVVWLTDLPRGTDGRYRAEIREVVVR